MFGVNNGNAVCSIILHNDVKSDMLTNISDLAIYGISIYNDIRELTKSDVRNSNRVVVVGRVPLDSLSDLVLYKETLDLNMYFIGSDSLMCSMMADFCHSFNIDYTRLDHSMLLSIFYNDKTILEQYKVVDYNESISTTELARKMVSDADSPALPLAKEYLLLRDCLESKIKLESLLKEKHRKLESDVLSYIKINDALVNEVKSLVTQYNEHYNTLKDYKIIFSEDLYDTVQLSQYKKTPKILYFKEYTDFLHMESFLETLKNVFTLQMKSSVKVVRLYDKCDVTKVKILQDRYHVVDGKFLASDIAKNDYILSYGNYLSLFDNLLHSPLDYLVIVDSKKFDNVVLVGDYLKLNLCRNYKDIDRLHLNEHTTIVNNHNRKLSWDTYEVYNEIISDADRFSYLSSRPVFRGLFDLINDII